jgi:hypothetical protein
MSMPATARSTWRRATFTCLGGEVAWNTALTGRLQGAFTYLADELPGVGMLHKAHAHHAVTRRT